MEEIWKDIPGYEGWYQASDLGRVKGVDRIVTFKNGGKKLIKESIKSQYLEKNGYYTVCLAMDRKRKTRNVHQLVAECFLNHIPCGYEKIVDHINNIKTDNRLENLQIITQRENLSKEAWGKNNYNGVYKRAYKKKDIWAASIQINKKLIHLGHFDDEDNALKFRLYAENNIELFDGDPVKFRELIKKES